MSDNTSGVSTKIVELYIRTLKYSTGQTEQIGRPILDHYCTAIETRRIGGFIPEADGKALEVAEQVCKEKRVELRVYDLGRPRDRLRSLLKGVSKTPIFVVGNQKLGPVMTKESILSLII